MIGGGDAGYYSEAADELADAQERFASNLEHPFTREFAAFVPDEAALASAPFPIGRSLLNRLLPSLTSRLSRARCRTRSG
jgi:hypothetical protein